MADFGRDTFIGTPARGIASDFEEGARVLQERVEELILALMEGARVVTCPLTPEMIPGITAADAFDANDCFGTIFTVRVPKKGIIYSGNFFDLDDEGTQVDLEIFSRNIAQVASDSAFAPTDAEILNFIYEMRFFAFDDHGTCQTSTIENVGKAYTAPEGLFYVQAVTRSTPTIAAGNVPRVQFQILSCDPNFKES